MGESKKQFSCAKVHDVFHDYDLYIVLRDEPYLNDPSLLYVSSMVELVIHVTTLMMI
jgi:hypothetical protein